MISDRHKCIFVHIPRCAGSSIENVIWPPPRRKSNLWMGFVKPHHNRYQSGGLQHLRAEQIRDAVGEERFSAYFKFTVVRNPFDRTVSQFSYMKRRPDLREFLGMAYDDSFPAYLDLIARREHVQWAEQRSFIYDDGGAPLVDLVIRFERLVHDIPRVFSKLGLDYAVLPHVNASDRGQYRAYYNPGSRALVEEIYKRDLERLSYEF